MRKPWRSSAPGYWRSAYCFSDKTPFLKQSAIDHVKKLEKIEQRVNQGVTGAKLDFPQY